MKKWIIIVGSVFLVLIFAMIYFVVSIQNDRFAEAELYWQIAQLETDIYVEQTERYHGDQLYYVFSGSDAEEEWKYVFVREDREVFEISANDMALTKDEAQHFVLEEYDELVHVQRLNPAHTGSHFAWEVVADDAEGNLQYVYLDMTDRSLIKRYTVQS